MTQRPCVIDLANASPTEHMPRSRSIRFFIRVRILDQAIKESELRIM